MGQILLGLLCGYVAFSDEGAKLRKQVMNNIKEKVVNDNDRNERLDSEQSVSSSTESSVGRSDVSQ